jgi:ketosteroid isomerase-like protein
MTLVLAPTQMRRDTRRAMSKENLEVVRRVDEAIEAKDMEALLALHHPDVEIVVLRSEIEGPYRGHDGLRRMATDMFEADYGQRIDERRDLGGNRVLVLGHQHATPRGARWEHVLAEIFEIESGKVTRLQAFRTVEEALEAAGLGE